MSDPTDPGAICADWWRAAITAESGSARQARAQLRRAATPMEALATPAAHDLNTRLSGAGLGLRNDPDRLALLAIVLAHVAPGSGLPPARRFGVGDPKALSPLRFETLLRARAPRDLILPMVRALRVVRGDVSASRLALDLYYWNDRTRTRWCFDYYGASDAKPDPEETPA